MSTLATPSSAFRAPAPRPLENPLGRFDLVRAVYRNPLEIWGNRAYNEPFIRAVGFGTETVIVSDPDMVRHVLVENPANYVMAPIRQAVLRPILRDGLLTAEGETWKRGRKAMAPMFTPRRIREFALPMHMIANAFAERYHDGMVADMSRDMTSLTYDILAETLFSGEIAGERASFEDKVNRLLDTMGRVDPLDLLGAPSWLPRVTRLPGRGALNYFRQAVRDTIAMRRLKLERAPDTAPQDLLTLLLTVEGPDGLTPGEVEDNVITFIGAGHETTARALGWTLYLLSQAPDERDRVEAELDAILPTLSDPNDFPDALPATRAAFEEAMRLYPPAPALNRMAVHRDSIKGLTIETGSVVLVMPWILHRHRLHWDEPDLFRPERFMPGNREAIGRFQYLPFGAGPRICIGQAFAMTEGVIALAALLSRWRFEATPQCKPWPVQKLTVQPQGGLPMRVVRRT